MGVTLCDEADLVERLRGTVLTTAQQTAWPGLAKEATALAEGFLMREYTVLGDVPSAVRVATSRMVVRAFGVNPDSPTQVYAEGTKSFQSSMGPMARTTTFDADVSFSAPWLSKAERTILGRFILRSSLSHQPMFDTEAVRTLGCTPWRGY